MKTENFGFVAASSISVIATFSKTDPKIFSERTVNAN